MSAPHTDLSCSISSTGHADGLGRRVLAFDRETGGMLERLHLRAELAAFDVAIREQTARLAAFRDERFARVRGVERDKATGELVVVSDYVPGSRLSDLLEITRENGIIPGVDVALGYLLEALPALAAFHTGAGFPHGLIDPSRTVLTTGGPLIFLDSTFGRIVERLGLSRRRLWTTFAIAAAPSRTPPRLDTTGDISQIALSSVMLVFGRALRESEYPDTIPSLLMEFVDIAQIRGSNGFAEGLQRILQRSLPLPGRRPFASCDEMLIDVRQLVRRHIGVDACRTALTEFVQQMEGTFAEDELPSIGTEPQDPTSEWQPAADEERGPQVVAIRELDDELDLLAVRVAGTESETTRLEFELPLDDLARGETDNVYELTDFDAGIFEPSVDSAPGDRVDATVRDRGAVDRASEPVLESPPDVVVHRTSAEEPVGQADLPVAKPSSGVRIEQPATTWRHETVAPAPLAAAAPPLAELVDVPHAAHASPARAHVTPPPAPDIAVASVGPAAPLDTIAPANAEPPEPPGESPQPAAQPPQAAVQPSLQESQTPPSKHESSRRKRRQQKSARARKDKLRSTSEPQKPASAATPPPPPVPPPVSKSGWLVPPERAAAFEPAVPSPQFAPRRPMPLVPQPPPAPPTVEVPVAPAFAPAEPTLGYPRPALPIAARPVVPPPVQIPEVQPATYGNSVPLRPQVGPASIAPAASAPIVKVKAEPPAGYTGQTKRRPTAPMPVQRVEAPAAFPYAHRGGLFETPQQTRSFPWKLAAAAVALVAIAVVVGRAYLPTRRSESAPPAQTVAANESAPSSATAPPPPGTGQIVVQTQPAGVRVLLDGKPAGESPITLDAVAPGRHILTFISSAGTVKRTVRVAANKSVTVDVPVFSGWLAIFAPVVLDISEDGKSLGTTEEKRIMIAPGHHRLTLSNRELGYRKDHEVDVDAGEVSSLTVDPRGSANFNAVPWAEVWMDGRKLGETPLANLPVPLGVREFIFKHPQHGERRVTATIRADQPTAVSVDFSKPQLP